MVRSAPVALLLAIGISYVAYLLACFPYDGLYGQDTYGYYGQALAWWRELSGEARPPYALYTSQEFRWPVGYHLHIVSGFLLGGVSAWGGWVLNVAMTVATPVLAYLLVGSLLPSSLVRFRVVAGLVTAALLLLSGTFVRFGLSLMADVPALFWALLGYLCAIKASLLDGLARRVILWALLAGLSLGIAVLTRYGALLLVPPLLVYLLLARRSGIAPAARPRQLLWAALGFALALVPQVAYLLTHERGAGYSAFLSDWSITNIIATTVTSADGTATYDYPMLIFYLVTPLVSASAGFLHFLTLPAFALGIAFLVQRKSWPALGLLLTWWLLPAIAFSGTPYQAHRFVIMYLPALVIPVGIGVSVAVEMLLRLVRGRSRSQQLFLAGAASVLLISVLAGEYFGWQGTRDWMAAHAAFKAGERRVITLARETVSDGEVPHVVALELTTAVYHYTGWPIMDLYNHDEAELQSFLSYGGPRLAIVSEENLATQWANTPTGARWRWLRANYPLQLRGTIDEYSVYRVNTQP